MLDVFESIILIGIIVLFVPVFLFILLPILLLIFHPAVIVLLLIAFFIK